MRGRIRCTANPSDARYTTLRKTFLYLPHEIRNLATRYSIEHRTHGSPSLPLTAFNSMITAVNIPTCRFLLTG